MENGIPLRLADLRLKYSQTELSSFPGDARLRYEAFSPYLKKLHDNLIVYKEKFVCLVRLRLLRVTQKGFHAVAVPESLLRASPAPLLPGPTTAWTFGANWSFVQLIDNRFSVPYAGFSVWPEAPLVQAVESLVNQGRIDEALSLIMPPRAD